MADHLVYSGIVSDDEAFEAPLVAEDVLHEVLVGMGGNAVKLVERRHYAKGTGVNSGLVRREVELAKPALAHVNRIVVAAGLGGAVSGKVLHACQKGVVCRQVIALVATHHCRSDEAAKVRILSGALADASPAGFHGDVAHGTIGPLETCGRGFLGSNLGALFNGLDIPGGAHAKIYGEYRAESVNDVITKQDGNSKAAFLHSDALDFTGEVGGVGVEKVAAAAGTDIVKISLAHGGAGD